MSPAGYWIGGGILVVGCGIAIIWFVVTIVGSGRRARTTSNASRVPGSRRVTLDDGDWTIYYESTYNRDWSYPPPSVTVTGPNGREINVQYSTDSLHVRRWVATTARRSTSSTRPTPGAYTIEAATVGEPGLIGPAIRSPSAAPCSTAVG